MSVSKTDAMDTTDTAPFADRFDQVNNQPNIKFLGFITHVPSQMSVFTEAQSHQPSNHGGEDPVARLKRELKASSQKNKLRLAYAAGALAFVILCCVIVYNVNGGRIDDLRHQVLMFIVVSSLSCNTTNVTLQVDDLKDDLKRFRRETSQSISSVTSLAGKIETKASSSSSKDGTASSDAIRQLTSELHQMDDMLADLETEKIRIKDKTDSLQDQVLKMPMIVSHGAGL